MIQTKKPLTKKQREILDFIEDFAEGHGYAPSFEEIATRFGYASLATVHEHLENLRAKGYIRKGYNESRSIEVVPTEMKVSAVPIPLMGNVAAGEPIEAIADQETVAVPEDMLGRGEHYVLRVNGDSMIEEQIRDGDYLVVKQRDTADNGEMVVALVDQESATVKKFYREQDGRVRLQPANAAMEPMYFGADRVLVQGIVVGVIRRYA
ncbi:MAG: transcriptional repressor LexA [Gemmatimonadetes bacterium]|nr:transcriptional repressor LexA [Gemmatimonadota bacterium]NIQ54869.1 transcriptional repressor LexA [Gemmatimonadota bacterium]NIU75067.1 transcriptional repressor LexA [Gammaproteobacteria bacterium]NIX45126.1 transcriptional repressor LexA [Gemmatimonadota bacterium]NIY09377.1 transcriptional repressor LexA [Gemmatimonadota bacterium]